MDFDQSKPHKGRIDGWVKMDGRVHGRFLDHPGLGGYDGHTSRVLKHDYGTDEIETLNSRYTLLRPIKDVPADDPLLTHEGEPLARIKPQMIVEKDGKRGVTVPDFMGCCAGWETPVVWLLPVELRGQPSEAYAPGKSFVGEPTQKLTVIGPEKAEADPAKCGAGTTECCIYLTVGAGGFACERFSDLRYTIMFRKEKMNAQYDPVVPYPRCQSERGQQS